MPPFLDEEVLATFLWSKNENNHDILMQINLNAFRKVVANRPSLLKFEITFSFTKVVISVNGLWTESMSLLLKHPNSSRFRLGDINSLS